MKIAEALDERSISWTRPPSITWKDGSGKKRKYFPDFFIPEMGLYLDPKNPWVMIRDKEKIEKVRQQIELIVGSPEHLLEEIDKRLHK